MKFVLKSAIIVAAISVCCSVQANAAKTMTCVETEASVHNNSYGRVISIELSSNKKEMRVSSPETATEKAFDEVVKRDNQDTTKNKDGNLDENYNRKTETRFVGSDDLVSTDIGTCLFIDKNVLMGKPGLLRLSGGQGNESDVGPINLWSESAVLECQ